jgi:GT2 family glycosyltransferase
MEVSVVLINYNSTKLTQACVKSLSKASAHHTLHTLVWDNASTIPPKSEQFSGATLVISSRNEGFARGYNLAVREALRLHQPDYLLILNNDTIVRPGMLDHLIERAKAEKGEAIIAPKIYFAAGHEFYRKEYAKEEKGKVIWYAGGELDWNNILPFHLGVDEVDRGQFEKEAETGFVSGCCFLISPKLWKKLGGFDSKYFMYYEDLDLSIRARNRGVKLVVEPKATLHHINAGSTEGSGSSIHQYYQTRNRIRFALKFGSFRARLAVLHEAERLWRSGTKPEKTAIWHALSGHFGMMRSV